MPSFIAGSTHNAKVTLTNPKTVGFDYTAIISLDSAASVQANFHLNAGESKDILFAVTMPYISQVYAVTLSVFSGGNLIASYRATEDVTVTAVTCIEGYVTDRNTGSGIEGIEVLVNYQVAAVTDSSGYYYYEIGVTHPTWAGRFYIALEDSQERPRYHTVDLGRHWFNAGENNLSLTMIPVDTVRARIIVQSFNADHSYGVGAGVEQHGTYDGIPIDRFMCGVAIGDSMYTTEIVTNVPPGEWNFIIYGLGFAGVRTNVPILRAFLRNGDGEVFEAAYTPDCTLAVINSGRITEGDNHIEITFQK
jgi:hypothetical protein